MVTKYYGLSRNQTRETQMKGLKGVVVVTTIVVTAAVLSACEKQIAEPPLKLGAGDVTVTHQAR